MALNNPGGLKLGAYNFIGQKTVGTNSTYKEFYELVFGVRAVFKNIQLISQRGMRSLEAIGNLWLGETEDLCDIFINELSKETGINRLLPIDLKVANNMKILAIAIIKYFNGQYVSEDIIDEGYELFQSNKLL